MTHHPPLGTEVRHPAFGEVVRIVNDVRLNFGDGQGTLGEVAERIIEKVATSETAALGRVAALADDLDSMDDGEAGHYAGLIRAALAGQSL